MMVIGLLLAFSLFGVDSSLTYGFSNNLSGSIGDLIFKSATLSGNRESILLYSTFFTVLADSQGIVYQKRAIVGGIVTSGICSVLKYLVNRKRPEGQSLRWNSSFPSGHSEMSAFIAVYFGNKYPKYRIPLYTWALLVGASRVYLKRHYVSDVITGYAIGTLGAYLTMKFYDKH